MKPAAFATELVMMVCFLAINSAANAADAPCKILLDAMTRYINTPSHMYSQTFEAGKPLTTESINTGTQRYILTKAGWRVNPIGTEQLLSSFGQYSKNAVCTFEREETVLGENTAVYSMKVTNQFGNTVGQYWISKRRALPVKQEQSISSGGDAIRKISERIVYDNVTAPNLVK